MQWTAEPEGSKNRRGEVQSYLRVRRVAPDTDVVQWAVPNNIAVDSEGSRLVWLRSDSTPPLGHMASQHPAMLREFVRLSNAPASKIVEYARKWGVLGVCEQHGLPGNHSDWRGAFASTCSAPTLAGESLGSNDPLAWHESPEQFAWEPLAEWRLFARKAQAMIAIGSSLHHGGPVDERYWHDLHAPYPKEVVPPPPSSALMTQIDLSGRVTQWLRMAGISPEYIWLYGEGPKLRFQPHGLFGALGLALGTALAQKYGTAICSYCHTQYFPSRQPTVGRRRFCPDCRKAKIPEALAGKERDARSRAAQK